MSEPLHPFRSDLDYYTDRAGGLLTSARDGTASAVEAFAEHGQPLTEAGARQVVAAEHGAGSWVAFEAVVAALAGSRDPFVRAYRAIEGRDVETLRTVLDAHPEVVTAKGTNGNDLLGMAGASCHLPSCELLLARGADPRAANVHGWTALHQAAYSDQPGLARRLLDAGADPGASARGDGGTPLVVGLFWGHRAVTETLAQHGLAPANLRVAAGLGELELLTSLFDADGAPAPGAGAHRDFYRPHGGFPPWSPADDPGEAVDEALAWAARSDRVDALDELVARGARLEADVYRGTALGWAAACDRPAAIRRLVALGADPDGRGTFGGPDHGRGLTALHLAADDDKLASLRALLELGADPTLEDAIYHRSPLGWAEHFGHRRAAAVLRDAAGG